MTTSLVELTQNPLFKEASSGGFIRLVLIEAAGYGMPPAVIALLDDLAAMLGYYEPLPKNQATLIGAPHMQWNHHPKQPVMERVTDLELLATKQRVANVLGAGKLGHMVGTAEIVVAMGNTIYEVLPPEYKAIFHWASVDTKSIILGEQQTKAQLWEKEDHPVVKDEDVILPTGRYYKTYQEIATSLRREAIAAASRLQARDELEPLAALFLAHYQDHGEDPETAAQAKEIGLSSEELAKRVSDSVNRIRRMFPDIDAYLPEAYVIDPKSKEHVKEAEGVPAQ